MFRKISMIAITFLLLFLMLIPNGLSNEIVKTSNGFGFRKIFTANLIINIDYDRPEENLIPLSGVLDIPLYTTFKLTGSFAKFIGQRSLLRNVVLQIELKVVGTEDWCEASITNPLVQLGLDYSEPYQSTLRVAVDERAPAFTQGIVKISATSKMQRGLIFTIAEETAEFKVSFIIGYLPAVSYKMPKGTIAEIGPLDTVDFQIDIKNLGNGPTSVEIELIDIPEEEWDINIASNVQLSSAVNGGEGASKSVHLKIKPSIDSDWNNERETFKVKFTPCYLGRADLVGQEEIITFNVQKIGSLKEEGSDIFLQIMVVVIIVLIITILIFFKRKKFNK